MSHVDSSPSVKDSPFIELTKYSFVQNLIPNNASLIYLLFCNCAPSLNRISNHGRCNTLECLIGYQFEMEAERRVFKKRVISNL